MVLLENAHLTATINPKGAELFSFYNKDNGIEYIWNGDSRFWGKRSPVLFPIVGALKNNYYTYQGHAYYLNKHGFARDMEFEIEQNSASEATFLLHATAETKKVFPFDFVLKLHYSLSVSGLSVTYNVNNPAIDNLYFSIGGHPAFTLPLESGTLYEDFYLEFELYEDLALQASDEGLMTGATVPFCSNKKTIPLYKQLFYNDALVLKDTASRWVSLLNTKTNDGLRFHYDEFPYLAIWSAKDAPFISLEPWCGIADSVSHNNNLIDKAGIICLDASSSWRKAWAIEVVANTR